MCCKECKATDMTRECKTHQNKESRSKRLYHQTAIAARVTVCLTAPACCDRACEQACTRWRERCVPSLQPRRP
jgi:hypothetical protein